MTPRRLVPRMKYCAIHWRVSISASIHWPTINKKIKSIWFRQSIASAKFWASIEPTDDQYNCQCSTLTVILSTMLIVHGPFYICLITLMVGRHDDKYHHVLDTTRKICSGTNRVCFVKALPTIYLLYWMIIDTPASIVQKSFHKCSRINTNRRTLVVRILTWLHCFAHPIYKLKSNLSVLYPARYAQHT